MHRKHCVYLPSPDSHIEVAVIDSIKSIYYFTEILFCFIKPDLFTFWRGKN